MLEAGDMSTARYRLTIDRASNVSASRHDGDWVSLGLRLGVAAGTVSALVGLASPIIEWRIENMPDRRLGIAGLIMMMIGGVFQSRQYWAETGSGAYLGAFWHRLKHYSGLACVLPLV